MTLLTDAQLSSLSVLLVEDMALVRQELRSQLAQLGIMNVAQAANADEAIDKLQRGTFDLVLSDYNLNRQTDGQQLLEYARNEGLITPATLFMMVTAQQEYVAVAAAAEVLPDDYVLKPFTTHALSERLKLLLARQVAFKAVNQHVARRDYARAAAACAELAQASGRHRLLALRRQAECLMEIGRHADARAIYEQLLALREDLTWARLGLARCLEWAGRADEAKAAAEALFAANPRYMQAHDLLAELAEDEGDTEAALKTLLASAEIVPSARRTRRIADAAYRAGDLACAREHWRLTCKLTRGSRTARPFDALQLAMVHLDEGDTAAAAALLADPLTAHAARTGTPAVAAATAALEARMLAQSGDSAGAQMKLQAAAAAGHPPGSDLSTVMLAGAHMALGDEEAASGLLASAVRADHDNPKLVALVRSAMNRGGLAPRIEQVVDEQIRASMASVKHAESLVRSLNHDGAVKCIEAALAATPNNTAVLLAASQITLLWLARQSATDRAVVAKIRGYLATLDKLLPTSPRVAMQHKFLHETLARLQQPRQPA